MNNNCKLTGYIITIILLVILLASNICVLKNQKNGVSSSNGAGADAWDVEIMKVGGEENWNLIEKIYKNQDYIDQQTQAIDQTIAEMNAAYGNEGNEEENTDTTQQSADVAEIVENLLTTAPVHGDKDARFTILEYSELLCGYCQRQSVNGTIDAVMAEFPGEVNSIHRHFIVHDAARELASAMECVAELKPDVYYDTLKKAFEEAPASVESIINIAGNLGADKDGLQSCFDEGRHLQAISDMENVGRTVFGISGTPGNVIIDRETGKYQILPGAYPAENFIEIINNMKNS